MHPARPRLLVEKRGLRGVLSGRIGALDMAEGRNPKGFPLPPAPVSDASSRFFSDPRSHVVRASRQPRFRPRRTGLSPRHGRANAWPSGLFGLPAASRSEPACPGIECLERVGQRNFHRFGHTRCPPPVVLHRRSGGEKTMEKMGRLGDFTPSKRLRVPDMSARPAGKFEVGTSVPDGLSGGGKWRAHLARRAPERAGGRGGLPPQ